jgi:hypothetical protein
MTGTDCPSGVCAAGVCQNASCKDAIRNGEETDVDCGGAICPTCSPGKACKLDTDCTNAKCVAGVCY